MPVFRASIELANFPPHDCRHAKHVLDNLRSPNSGAQLGAED